MARLIAALDSCFFRVGLTPVPPAIGGLSVFQTIPPSVLASPQLKDNSSWLTVRIMSEGFKLCHHLVNRYVSWRSFARWRRLSLDVICGFLSTTKVNLTSVVDTTHHMTEGNASAPITSVLNAPLRVHPMSTITRLSRPMVAKHFTRLAHLPSPWWAVG